ncbi:hypothetical protein Tco_0255855 [Tanacetum coccineum]
MGMETSRMIPTYGSLSSSYSRSTHAKSSSSHSSQSTFSSSTFSNATNSLHGTDKKSRPDNELASTTKRKPAKGFICRSISAIHWSSPNTNTTTAYSRGRDVDGDTFKTKEWKYQQVVSVVPLKSGFRPVIETFPEVFSTSINLKYPPILDPRLKALAADLYALTRYVDAKDRPSGTNDEESEHRLAQLQDQLPSNEPVVVEDNGKGKVHDIQNRVGSVEVDLARAIKAKQVDDHDDDDLDTLDLENKIKKLEDDFAKKAKEAKLKAKKAKNAKEAMLAEVVQISSDEDDDEDPTAPTSTRFRAPTASTSTRSRASIASTSNAKAVSTAPRGYRKITMTGCVITLFAPNALNAPPPSATRKRKST